MIGFRQAMNDYERHRDCPYDFGGALFDYEEYAEEQERIREDIGNMIYDRHKEDK